jgi:hypothetical protein
VAWRGASSRLLLWSTAFEYWLDEQIRALICWRGPLGDTKFRLQALNRIREDHSEVNQEMDKGWAHFVGHADDQ